MNAAPQAWRGPGATTKYRNRKTVLDGVVFDSKAEANRFATLCILERAGQIHTLRRQCKFPLYVMDWLLGHYVADFVYFRNGKRVVEDVKGTTTPLFDWKALHFHAQYGQEIEVVR